MNLQLTGQIGAALSNSEAVLPEKSLKETAKDLEATFLSEMLKSAGIGKVQSEFGGGVGEDHFSSFLVDQQAQILAEHGGVGLAELILKSLQSEELQ